MKAAIIKAQIQEKNQPMGHRPGKMKVEVIMKTSFFTTRTFGVPMAVKRKTLTLSAICLFVVVASQASALVIRQEASHFFDNTVRIPVKNTFIITNTASGNKRACSGGTDSISPAPTAVSFIPVAAPPCQLPVAHFPLGSSDLSPSEVNLVLTSMEQCHVSLLTPLHIIGHTCRLGKDQKNQVLSKQRAQRVAAELRAHGYTIEEVKEMGSQNPVTTNHGLIHLNRRVEITK